MRKSILLFCLLLLAFQLHASIQDSLLKQYPDRGIEYVDALNSIGFSLLFQDPDSSYSLFQEALVESERIDYPTGIAKASANLGSYFAGVGLSDDAKESYTRSIDIARENGLKRLESNTQSRLAIMYARQGKFDLALENLFASLEIIEVLGDSSQMGDKWINIGATYASRGELDQAEKYFEMSRQIAEQRKDTLQMTSSLQNLANLMVYTQRSDSALVLLEQVRQLLIAQKDNESLAGNLNSIGVAYMSLEKNDLAMDYFEQAIAIARERNLIQLLPTYYLNVGDLWLAMDNKEKSLENIHYAIEVAKSVEKRLTLLLCYEKLVQVHENYGEFAPAFDYQKKAYQLRDSIFNAEKATFARSLEARYELGKKQSTIVSLKDQTATQEVALNYQKAIIALLVIGLIVLVVLAWIVLRMRNLRAENERKHLEQRLLRSQLNPHFIFNCMNSIQSYLYQNEKDQVSVFLSRFAGLMRHILHSSREMFVSLDEEVASLETYLDLQQLRFQGGFEYDIHIDEEIETDLVGIPPLFVQPFVENAIEHGIRTKGAEGKVSVRYRREGDVLRVEIEDNGIGREAADQQKSTSNLPHLSVSTGITLERLKLLFRLRGRRSILNINDVRDKNGQVAGTKVDFCLPLGPV